MDVRSLTKEAWVKSVPERMPNGNINIHVKHVVSFSERLTALLGTENSHCSKPRMLGIARVVRTSSRSATLCNRSFPSVSFRQVKPFLF